MARGQTVHVSKPPPQNMADGVHAVQPIQVVGVPCMRQRQIQHAQREKEWKPHQGSIRLGRKLVTTYIVAVHRNWRGWPLRAWPAASGGGRRTICIVSEPLKRYIGSCTNCDSWQQCRSYKEKSRIRSKTSVSLLFPTRCWCCDHWYV